MAMSGVKEASDMFVGDKGSCDPVPRCWELHMKATMVEGTAHENYNNDCA